MFQRQFEPKILRKRNPKRQTIRPHGKRRPKVGDLEVWCVWIGLPYRSKQRELKRVRITSVESVTIRAKSILLGRFTIAGWDEKWFARLDGFGNEQLMRDWFRKNHRLPFRGILIKAEDS